MVSIFVRIYTDHYAPKRWDYAHYVISEIIASQKFEIKQLQAHSNGRGINHVLLYSMEDQAAVMSRGVAQT